MPDGHPRRLFGGWFLDSRSVHSHRAIDLARTPQLETQSAGKLAGIGFRDRVNHGRFDSFRWSSPTTPHLRVCGEAEDLNRMAATLGSLPSNCLSRLFSTARSNRHIVVCWDLAIFLVICPPSRSLAVPRRSLWLLPADRRKGLVTFRRHRISTSPDTLGTCSDHHWKSSF